MKTTIYCLIVTLAMLVSARAEVNTKLSKVHLCCKSCVTGAEKSVAKVSGVTATVDKDAGTIELSGPDAATVQKAADALIASGYFGVSSNPDIKIKNHTGAKGAKVQTLQVNDVHLCCGKCVKAVDEALKAVPGVKGNTAEKNAKTFEVTGDFNDKEALTALQNVGLTGTVGK